MSPEFEHCLNHAPPKPSGLSGLLENASAGHCGLRCLDLAGEETRLSYAELGSKARERLGELNRAGLKKGDFLVFQLADGIDFLTCLWACFLGGILPVPATVQDQYSRELPASQKLVDLSSRLDSAPIVTRDADLSKKLELPTLVLGGLESSSPIVDPQWNSDPALILLTSGSTSRPKLVPLSSDNLVAMALGTVEQNGFDASDVTLNWMPLDHVGAVSFLSIMPVVLGCEQIHVPTRRILADPLRWLELVEQHRATISWAPNFAFALILKNVERLSARSFDLSSMRFLVNAGEMVNRQTMLDFLEALEKHRLPPDALRPAFGMSETCSGITWSPGVTRTRLQECGQYLPLGSPMPGAQLRIVDDKGRSAPRGEQGLLQLKGPSVLREYLRDEKATAQAFTADGWFKTGDLGMLVEGELILTGREKEQIILAGVNYSAQEIESTLADIEGVDASLVAAFSVHVREQEELAIVYAVEDGLKVGELDKRIREAVGRRLGVAVSYLKELPAEEFPRTSIGKIRRGLLQRIFEPGRPDPGVHARRPSGEETPRDGKLLTKIREIWAEVLEIESVAPRDGFFELGGHSLLVPQLQMKLEQGLNMPVPISVLFSCPTPADMAAELGPHKSENEQSTDELRPKLTGGGDIAVIGMALRFPGANDPDTFWQNLTQGIESITDLSEKELLLSGVSPDLFSQHDYVRRRPTVDQPDGFDARFFGYSRAEAELLDPQQRIGLECCWSCLEDAGYPANDCKSEVGVFLGASTNTYLLNRWSPQESVVTLDSSEGFRMMVANDKDFLPTRVSYHLNLKGPSVNVQTACSTGLVAVHSAVQSLRSGESHMALAGGVSINYPQDTGYRYQEGMIVSPDGHCRAFDEKAQGTVFGNGAGVVLLKRAEDAMQDGDQIYALIKGTAINNDGGLKQSFNAPNGVRQTDVVRQALADAKVDASTISLVEAHGTGTLLGDPIEFQALSRAFRRDTKDSHYCALGSVKTNVGHLQIASGIAGFLKAVLCLYHKAIPATLHFSRPNPHLDMETSPFFINSELLVWADSILPRRAGVNSLGIGGTNAHVVLEEAPIREPKERAARAQHPLALSAATKPALEDLSRKIADSLDEEKYRIEDVAHTICRSRSLQSVRRFLQVESIAELKRRLLEPFPASTSPSQNVTFCFSGQGSGYFGMGRELYETEPHFRATFDRCDSLVQELGGNSLVRFLFREESPGFKSSPLLQAATFSIQVSLVASWKAFGIEPDAVLGHSLGEFAAACTAGIMDLETALALVLERGRLMSGLEAGGAMLIVWGDVGDCSEWLTEDVAVAAFNTPTQTVLSGPRSSLETISLELKRKGLRHRFLPVEFAFHSPLVTPVLERFSQSLSELRTTAPRIPIYSSVTASDGWPDMGSASYWSSQLVNPVRFWEAVEACRGQYPGSFLEIGPSSQLCSLGLGDDDTPWFSSLKEGQGDWSSVLSGLGGLYLMGHSIDWDRLNHPYAKGKVSLPTYPFQRQKYALPRKKKTRSIQSRRCYNTLEHSFLEGHRIKGETVLSAASLILLCQEFTKTHFEAPLKLRHFKLLSKAVAGPDSQIEIKESETVDREIEIFQKSTHQSEPKLVASGRLSPSDGPTPLALPPEPFSPMSPKELYQQFRIRGLDHGPGFHTVQTIEIQERGARARIALPPCASEIEGHPGLLDGALQVLASALITRGHEELYLPVAIRELGWACDTLPDECQVRALFRFQESNGSIELGDLDIADPSGNLLFWVRGLSVRPDGPQELPVLLTPHWAPVTPVAIDERTPEDWALVDPSQVLCDAPKEQSFRSPEELADKSWAEIVWLLPPCGQLETEADFKELLEPVLVFLQKESRRIQKRRVCFVTQGCQPVNRAVTAPEHGAVWGLVRSVAREYPELGLQLLDLSPGEHKDWLEQILTAKEHPGSELAFCRGELFKLESRSWTPNKELIRPHSLNYKLVHPEESAGRPILQEIDMPRPGPCEVLVEVQAHGLNFRDVLSRLGKVPAPVGGIVGECAGLVSGVGADVQGLRVGEPVVALVSRPFQRYVVADRRLVIPLPQALTPEEGAGLAICSLTAYYSLRTLGNIQSGDTVLIHSAASGVGLAALNLCKSFGVRVVATAHPSKWAYLRSLGVECVENSRHPGFSSRIRRSLSDSEINLVLSATSEEIREESLLLLADSGVFVDLSKVSDEEIEATKLRHPGVRYYQFDLSEFSLETLEETLSEISKLLEDGSMQPIPVLARPMTRAPDCFQEMARGRHIGKYVLYNVASPGTVLITGGTGALGVRIAKEHLRSGCKSLLLIARRPPPESTQEELGRLAESLKAIVHWRTCDVADLSAIKEAVHSSPSPIIGVVHAAGVLKDNLLSNQNWPDFWIVLQTKALGARNLHLACQDQSLQFFELFSSAAAWFGSPGQANYSAANALLDSLAWMRRGLGLPSQVLNWGAWHDLGMARGQAQLIPEIGSMSSQQAVEGYRVVRQGPTQVAVWGRSEQATPSLTSPVSVRDVVVTELTQALGLIEQLDPDESFANLGLDSLMSLEIRNRLSRRLNVRLPVDLLYQYPDLNSLLSRLKESLGSQKVVQNEQSTASEEESAVKSPTVSKLESFATALLLLSFFLVPFGLTVRNVGWRVLSEQGFLGRNHFESYFERSLGAKRTLDSAYASAPYFVFGEPVLGLAMRPLVGRDGWWFLPSSRRLDLPPVPLSEAEVESWSSYFRENHKNLSRAGIRYLVVIPPMKESVYQEHLPSWMVLPSSQFDRVRNSPESATVTFIDPKPALLRSKSRFRLFPQKSLHWNEIGGFIASELALDAFGISADIDDYEVEEMTIEAELPRIARLPKMTENTLSLKRVEPVLWGETSLWSSRTERTVATTNFRNESPTAIVFHDSFGWRMHKFLAPHFSRLTYIRHAGPLNGLVERELPEVVIHILAEDQLLGPPPSPMSALGVPGVNIPLRTETLAKTSLRIHSVDNNRWSRLLMTSKLERDVSIGLNHGGAEREFHFSEGEPTLAYLAKDDSDLILQFPPGVSSQDFDLELREIEPRLSAEELFRLAGLEVRLNDFPSIEPYSELPSDIDTSGIQLPSLQLAGFERYVARVELTVEQPGEVELRWGESGRSRRGYFYAYRAQRRLKRGRQSCYFVIDLSEAESLRLVFREVEFATVQSVTLRGLSKDLVDKYIPGLELPANPLAVKAQRQ
jgi:acyl transferase domain-containing protein/acyl-CoA synthetase (AMP-forming)/AMP-acid ligase II/NADPH:quinone reductase-like Zn-dependent oxidoreductase/acyl carrier protein